MQEKENLQSTLDQLDQLATSLETDDIAFESAIETYATALATAKKAATLLKNNEQTIETLEEETIPFVEQISDLSDE